jgi:hypothetical protein
MPPLRPPAPLRDPSSPHASFALTTFPTCPTTPGPSRPSLGGGGARVRQQRMVGHMLPSSSPPPPDPSQFHAPFALTTIHPSRSSLGPGGARARPSSPSERASRWETADELTGLGSGGAPLGIAGGSGAAGTGRAARARMAGAWRRRGRRALCCGGAKRCECGTRHAQGCKCKRRRRSSLLLGYSSCIDRAAPALSPAPTPRSRASP